MPETTSAMVLAGDDFIGVYGDCPPESATQVMGISGVSSPESALPAD
jgi:hypothetical protein